MGPSQREATHSRHIQSRFVLTEPTEDSQAAQRRHSESEGCSNACQGCTDYYNHERAIGRRASSEPAYSIDRKVLKLLIHEFGPHSQELLSGCGLQGSAGLWEVLAGASQAPCKSVPDAPQAAPMHPLRLRATDGCHASNRLVPQPQAVSQLHASYRQAQLQAGCPRTAHAKYFHLLHCCPAASSSCSTPRPRARCQAAYGDGDAQAPWQPLTKAQAQELHAFAEALLSSEFKGRGRRVLEMPDIEYTLLPEALKGSMYVRELYRPLLKRVAALPKESSMVITGVSGTGRSKFALMILSHLAKQRQRVIWTGYRSGSPVTIMLDLSGSSVVVGYTSRPVGEMLWMDPDVWVIADGPAPYGQADVNGRMVVLCAPKEDNWYQFSKGKCNQGVLWVSSWTLEELEEARRLLFSQERDKDWVANRFTWAGGSVRDVLVKDEHTWEEMQWGLDAQEAAAWVNDSLLGLRSKYSHQLIHTWADANFKVAYKWPASPMVAHLLYSRALDASQQRILGLIAGAEGHGVSGAVRGLMFEQHGHVVCQVGTGARSRQLLPPAAAWSGAGAGAAGGAAGAASNSDAEAAASSALLPPESHNHPLTAAAAPTDADRTERIEADHFAWYSPDLDFSNIDCVYVRPRTTNNRTWDAVIIKSSEILILQFTVADHHQAVGNDVVRLLEHIDPAGQRKARFAFVVPETAQGSSVFNKWVWQPWRAQGGKQAPQCLPQQRLQSVEQWVFELPILSPEGRVPAELYDAVRTTLERQMQHL